MLESKTDPAKEKKINYKSVKDIYGLNPYLYGDQDSIVLNKIVNVGPDGKELKAKNYTIEKLRLDYDKYKAELDTVYTQAKTLDLVKSGKIKLYYPSEDLGRYKYFWLFLSIIATDSQFNNNRCFSVYSMPGLKNYGMCGITKCMLDVYNEAFAGYAGYTKKTLNDLSGCELTSTGDLIYVGNDIKIKTGTLLENLLKLNVRVGFFYFMHIYLLLITKDISTNLKYWINCAMFNKSGQALANMSSGLVDFIAMYLFKYGVNRAILDFGSDYLENSNLIFDLINDFVDMMFWYLDAFMGKL